MLYGNIAPDGTFGFAGPARICESEDMAVAAILGDKIRPGDAVLIRYERPRGAAASRPAARDRHDLTLDNRFRGRLPTLSGHSLPSTRRRKMPRSRHWPGARRSTYPGRRAKLPAVKAGTFVGGDVADFQRCVSAILGVVLFAALPGCNEENKYEPPPAPKVGVAQPAKRPVTRYLELTGNMVSLDKVELVARVPGFLREIDYQDGSMVKQGDVLFVIEPAPYEAKVQQAEAEVAAVKAKADFAEAEFQRQYALSQTTQFGWQSKFYEAQRNREESRANLQKAEAALALAKIELGYTNIAAPFDGIVTTHQAAVGALVGSGKPTRLATILRLDPIHVTANLSEQDVLRIIADPKGISTADLGKIPIELGLMTETGYPHRGVIDYIAPQVDPSTATLEVRGVLANPGHELLPGMFAHARVAPSQAPAQDALLVPEAALGNDQAGRYVLVVDKDDVVDKRSVAVGPAVGDMRVIEEGLGAGDRVVVAGLSRAVPGQKVKTKLVASTASSKRADAAR